MGYYRVLREIRDLLPRDAIIASEGANTMDIGRTVLPNFEPRHRLDAGTFGTMGVGPGLRDRRAPPCTPTSKVVAVEGDSAFGFSGMEVEVACRYQLPITFIVLNNNGIGGGLDASSTRGACRPRPTCPARATRSVIEAFGGQRLLRREARRAGSRARSRRCPSRAPTVVNVMIDAARRPQAAAVRLAHALTGSMATGSAPIRGIPLIGS